MTKRFNFQAKPVTKAIGTFAAMLAASSAFAGPGFGDAYDLNGNPFIIQSYFASSPSGPRLWVDGTGAPAPLTGAPGSYDPANQTAYADAVAKLFPGGYPGTGTALRKFVDALPLPEGHALFAKQTANTVLGGITKYIPVAKPVKWIPPNTVTAANPAGVASTEDYYEIAVIEFVDKFHTDLIKATTLRGYVQIDQYATNGLAAPMGWVSKAVPLFYPDGTTPIMVNKTDATGKLVPGVAPGTYEQVQAKAVDDPHYLGPVIASTKGTPTRVKFLNLLPVGRAETESAVVKQWNPETAQFVDVPALGVKLDGTGRPLRHGDLFLPLDPSVPGSGLGPDGFTYYTQNRANMHLHGGDNPWISDGTPHQWITPAGELDASQDGSPGKVLSVAGDASIDPSLVEHFTRGIGAKNVPDMYEPGPGAMTYYFPNGQSARMEWYHDHSVGITRLNVYAGMAAAYLLTDPVEAALKTGGPLPDGLTTVEQVLPDDAHTLPLVLQDKMFVPDDIALQDARWSTTAWGQPGDQWFPHVYETVQDPNQATNFNSVGRWHWGPWFWPSFPSMYALPTGVYGDVTLTPEAWMDTPVINGVAYPTLNVDPTTYRLRILNASNDRTFTFNMFVADPAVVDAAGAGTGLTEVKMIPANSWSGGTSPAPACTTLQPFSGLASRSVAGCVPETWSTDVYGHNGGVPDFLSQGPTLYQIASEGGFLPGVAPKDPGPLNFLLDKGRAAVLNTDYGLTGLHIGNAERADVLVDFSQYAGKTLIVYNDAGAPVPAADPRNEYFTGYGDNSATGGAEDTLPGYGPNTRTLMRIVVAATGATTPLDPAVLDANLKKAYKASQETPVVAQAAYNGALGTSWNDNKSFANIFTGSLKQPTFNFVPGTEGAVYNSILMQTQGSGYIRTPDVTISQAAGDLGVVTELATAKASLKIDKIHVINAGSGYKVAPVVTIVSNGPGSGVSATANLGVTAIQLTAAGSGYTSAPTVTFQRSPLGVAFTASGHATVNAAKQVTGIIIDNPGSGYGVAPTVTLSGGGGFGAKATTSCSVAGVTVDIPDPLNPESGGGGGYTDLSTATTEPANPAPGMNIRFTAPPAGGTAPTAGFTGRVFDITLVNPGKGYGSAPVATVSPPVANPVLAALAAPPVLAAATAKADTAGGGTPTGSILVKTKAIQELFDPTYGRLNATFGVEIPYTSALTQTTIPLGYVDAPTEEFANNETQIWKITHNGVDSHPIHFHLLNVQLINRVGWDNFASPPELNELGWKETIKVSPLEDAIVAVRAKRPSTGVGAAAWGVPNSVRLLDPAQPEGAMTGFTQIDPNTGTPAAMANVLADFGWEYVWHCHILGHEENDFMRPWVFHANDVIPVAPSGLAGTLTGSDVAMTWTDNAATEFAYRLESAPVGGAFTPVGANLLANAANATATLPAPDAVMQYRVVAVGQAGESVSNTITVTPPPAAPTGFQVTAHPADSISLGWTDVATNETGYTVTWSTGGGAGTPVALGVNAQATTVSGLVANTVYDFALSVTNDGGTVAGGNTSGTTAPLAATLSAATALEVSGTTAKIDVTWGNTNPNLGTLTSVTLTGTVDGVAIAPVDLGTGASGVTTLTNQAAGKAYSLTITVVGAGGTATTTVTGNTAEAISLVAATGMSAQLRSEPTSAASFVLKWADVSLGETSYQALVCRGTSTQCATAPAAGVVATWPGVAAAANTWYVVPAANVTYTGPVGATGAASAVVSNLVANPLTRYYFSVKPLIGATAGPGAAPSAAINLNGAVTAPTGVSATAGVGSAVVSWTDTANNNAGDTVQYRTTAGVGSVTVVNRGLWLALPTVVFGAPVAGGVQATGHVVAAGIGGIAIVIDNAGKGYIGAPSVTLQGGIHIGQTTGLTVNSSLGATWVGAWTNSAATPLGDATGTTVTGLAAGPAYQFRVSASSVTGGAGNSGFTVSTNVVVAQ